MTVYIVLKQGEVVALYRTYSEAVDHIQNSMHGDIMHIEDWAIE
ncbi:hypothetical protein HOU74_gp42 [Pectobacterium phage Phoria]|uniref:Uncharacterized protein n=2 Tax=Phimunavirus TaxID=2560202 RepID=A0A385IF81_9CAUD|nr:hypothetical protein HOU11_gp06 [Pectobacterium phage Gaspode]YP_009817307.1 hypothetical protein HOU74_gp42 [Pectobacterium phage Phoria]AXY81663.1 hypothetical protein [Pectobacterium phage Gaspode]AZF94948.1 hypothetical protein [Pectobacterium phage Phoria]